MQASKYCAVSVLMEEYAHYGEAQNLRNENNYKIVSISLNVFEKPHFALDSKML